MATARQFYAVKIVNGGIPEVWQGGLLDGLRCFPLTLDGVDYLLTEDGLFTAPDERQTHVQENGLEPDRLPQQCRSVSSLSPCDPCDQTERSSQKWIATSDEKPSRLTVALTARSSPPLSGHHLAGCS